VTDTHDESPEERKRAAEGWSDFEGGKEVWGLDETGDEALTGRPDRDDMPFEDGEPPVGPGAGGPALPPEGGLGGGLRLFLQFAGFPLLIVAVCTGVFLLFGVIASEEHTPMELLRQVRTGSEHKRWQAAYELAKHLVASPEVAADQELGQAILETFRESKGKDPEVRKYLAQTIGTLRHPGAGPALREALDDESADVRLYAALSIGTRGDREAVPAVIERLRKDEDDGVRTAAASALTLLADPTAGPALREALLDAQRDVRWNAALALAAIGDAEGRSLLHELLDRTRLLEETEMTEELSAQSALHALDAIRKLGGTQSVDVIRKVASEDGDPRVRAKANEVLASLLGASANGS